MEELDWLGMGNERLAEVLHHSSKINIERIMAVYSVHLSIGFFSFGGKNHINFLRGQIRIIAILAWIQNFSKTTVKTYLYIKLYDFG